MDYGWVQAKNHEDSTDENDRQLRALRLYVTSDDTDLDESSYYEWER